MLVNAEVVVKSNYYVDFEVVLELVVEIIIANLESKVEQSKQVCPIDYFVKMKELQQHVTIEAQN